MTAPILPGPTMGTSFGDVSVEEATAIYLKAEAQGILRFVDDTNLNPTPTGTIQNPYSDPQDAIDDIATFVANGPGTRLIIILGGGPYLGPALTIPTTDGGIWMFWAWSAARLGTFGGPGSERNLVRTVDPAYSHALAATINLVGLLLVVGKVEFLEANGGAAQNFTMRGQAGIVGLNETAALDGSTLANALNVELIDAFLGNALNAPTMQGPIWRSDFYGSVSVDKLGDCERAFFSANPTMLQAPGGIGFRTCEMGGGAFTGPAGSAKFDRFTEQSWQDNAGTFAGGATIQRTDSPLCCLRTQPDYSANYGALRVRSLAGTGAHRFNFSIPSNFGSLVSAEIVGVVNSGGAPGSGKDIDLESNYGNAQTEPYNQHVETDTTSTYTIPAQDQWFRLDVSSVLTGLSADDAGGILVDHNSIGGSVGYVFFEIVYQPA